jgi:WD40 repeat protein
MAGAARPWRRTVKIHGPNDNHLEWKNLRDPSVVRDKLEEIGKQFRAGRQTEGTNHNDNGGVFRDPRPPIWDRPRPVVFPEALEAKGRSDGLPNVYLHLVMAPDGSRLGATTEYGLVFLVNPSDGNLLQSIKAPLCEQIALSCRGQLTVVTAHLRKVFLCGSDTDTVDACPKIAVDTAFHEYHDGLKAKYIAVSADDRWFAAFDDGGLLVGEMSATFVSSATLSVCHAGRRERTGGLPYDLHSNVRAMAWHPRSDWLALISIDDSTSELWIYDPDSDRLLTSAVPPFSYIKRAFRWAAGFGDASGTPMGWGMRIPWATAGIPCSHAMAMDAQGSLMGLLGDRSVTLLRIETQRSSESPGKRVVIEHLGAIECDEGGLHAIAMSSDSRLVAAAGKGAVIRVWETKTRRQLCKLTCDEEPGAFGDVKWTVLSLAFHPNNHWLFSAGRSGLIRRWSLTKQPDGGLRATCDRAMEALPDGNWVVWHDPDGPNRRWVEPKDDAKRWLGWRMPSGEYRPFDAF